MRQRGRSRARGRSGARRSSGPRGAPPRTRSAMAGRKIDCISRLPMPKPACAAAPKSRMIQVDHADVDRHQRELAARGQPDVEHAAPRREPGPPLRRIEVHVLLEAHEVGREEGNARGDGERAGQPRSRHPHRMPRSPAGDEHGGEQRIQQDRERLHDHRRLDDARAAQRGAQRHERELQREARNEPAQVRGSGGRRGLVGAEHAHVRGRDRIAAHQRHDGAQTPRVRWTG